MAEAADAAGDANVVTVATNVETTCAMVAFIVVGATAAADDDDVTISRRFFDVAKILTEFSPSQNVMQFLMNIIRALK